MYPSHKPMLFVGIGVVVWFAFLIAIRVIGSSVFSTGNPVLLLFYVAALPLTAVTIISISLITRVPSNEMVMPTFIMTTVALLMDGLAVNFTDFYGPSDDQVRASAAFLLWGAGAGLLASLWLAHRPKTEA